MRAPKPDKAHSISQGFMYILLYINFFILPALKTLARESARESVRRVSNTLSLFRTSRILSLIIHSLFARSSWLSHICGRSTKIKWMGMTAMHRHSRHRPVIPMQLFLVSFGCFGSKVGGKAPGLCLDMLKTWRVYNPGWEIRTICSQCEFKP